MILYNTLFTKNLHIKIPASELQKFVLTLVLEGLRPVKILNMLNWKRQCLTAQLHRKLMYAQKIALALFARQPHNIIYI